MGIRTRSWRLHSLPPVIQQAWQEINPPQVIPEEPNAVRPTRWVMWGQKPPWLRYPTCGRRSCYEHCSAVGPSKDSTRDGSESYGASRQRGVRRVDSGSGWGVGLTPGNRLNAAAECAAPRTAAHPLSLMREGGCTAGALKAGQPNGSLRQPQRPITQPPGGHRWGRRNEGQTTGRLATRMASRTAP